MEDLILAQVRGLLILANAHRKNGNTIAYWHYLNRAKGLLAKIETERNESYVQRAA